MNLQTLALSGTSALSANGSALTLRTPVALNGRNVFRRVFGLRIGTGGVANQVLFDADAAHMAIVFEPDTFDIRDAGHALLANKGTQALEVTLPAPMQVKSALFASSTAAATIEFYRLDGDEIADDPTKTIGNDGTVGGDFTDRRFVMKAKKADASPASISPSSLQDLDVKGFPTAARIGLATHGVDPSKAFFFHIVPGEVGKPDGPSGSADIGPALAAALQQHVASLEAPYPANIDLILVAESDAPCVLRVNSFSLPFGLVRTSFRAVLLRTDDVTSAPAFCARLRDAATPLTSYLRGKLNTATRNALDRNQGTIPEPVLESIARDLNVALQAEAFYTAQRFAGIELTAGTLAQAQAGASGVARTRLNRTLLAEAFPDEVAPITEPDADEKEVLEADGATSALTVLVDLPRTATIRSATLTLEGDLRGDAPADAGSNGGTGGTPDWDAAIPDSTGVLADAGRAIARRIEPESAIDASALSLALASTAPAAELIAEIREDQNGTPAGRALATGNATIGELDRPAWVRFPFRSSVVVQALPHWIVLRATNGSALWLAADEDATTRVGPPEPKGWTDSGGFDGVAPLHHIWARSSNGATAAGSGSNADPGARLRAFIGSAKLSPALGEGRARTFNIAAAVQSALSATGGSSPIIALPIRITALGKGSVTVYPPKIEYDV